MNTFIQLSEEDYNLLNPKQKFWYRVRQLINDFPTEYPVVVRTKEHKTLLCGGSRVYGFCQYSEKTKAFTIMIERNDDLPFMLDTLYHEYAHVMVWTKCSRYHGRRFWLAYGKIYRRYQDKVKT